MELYKKPLDERQIAILSTLRVGLYTDRETGCTFISKSYWKGVSQNLRDALARVLA